MRPVVIETDEKNKKQLLDFYHHFMSKEKAKAQAFHSLDEFKKSALYRELPEEEKEHFKSFEGKQVIILVFDNAEQCIKFIEQAQDKGLISKKQAEAAISKINEYNQSSHKMGM